MQGRNIWSGRLTGAGHDEEPGDVLSRAAVAAARARRSRPAGTAAVNAPRDWVALGTNTFSPEADLGYFDLPYSVTQATWSNPLTNKMLLEAGFSRFAYTTNGGTGTVSPDGIFDQIPVTGAVGDRRPQCQLQLPRRERLSCTGRHAERVPARLGSPT